MNKNAVRTKMSVINALCATINRLLGMVFSFISRTVFVKVLGAEYLGLGGLFGNIFSVISLCELGFGAAFCQSLYKPIAKGDSDLVCSIMSYFRKVYNAIALISGVLGVCVMPFLRVLVSGKAHVQGLYCIYVLFLLHNVVSFLLTPKRMLVVCDQRMYAVSNISSVFSALIFVFQILALKTTGSYIVYLSCRIILLCVQGVAINIYADRRYGFLRCEKSVSKQYRQSLFANVKALMLHKIGGVLTHSTDSILISYCLGLTCMGKYSNYALVIGSVTTFIDIAIGAVSSSVGNLGASAGVNKNISVMKRLCFVNFAMLTVCSSVLICTLNPFVEIWLGKEMLFSLFEAAIIVGSFYFSCIRDPIQLFISGYGIFAPSRYMNLCRAFVNLTTSVLFIKTLGIAGVFLGTIISVVAVPLWFEPYVLFKHGFKCRAGIFWLEFLSYPFITLGICAVCVALTGGLPVSIYGVIVRAVSAFGVSALLLLVLYPKKLTGCIGDVWHKKYALNFLRRMNGILF